MAISPDRCHCQFRIRCVIVFFLFIVCAPEPAVQPVETSQCALNVDHLCIMSRNARKSCNGSTGKAGQGSQPHLFTFLRLGILGSATFLLAWFCFLFSWSIPLIITEYTLGRFTRGSPITAFIKFLGKKFVWVGAWVTAIAFFIRYILFRINLVEK